MDNYGWQKMKEKRNVLTKTVNPDWYRRYAKVLNYEDRIYLQPLREIREERKMLKDLETPPNESDKAIQMSQKLTEARSMRIRFVLRVLEGNLRNIDLSCLKPSTETPLSVIVNEDVEKVQTLFWRQRAVRPPGYVLSTKSKWRLFWDNPMVMKKFHELVVTERRNKIRRKWKKSFRLIQCISRFTMNLAEIAMTTAQVFKDFVALFDDDAQFFQKNNFKATSVGKNLDENVLFHLSKPMYYRNPEDAHEAAKALRVMQSFAEFPAYMQDKICEVAWYLELDKDKFLIRQGQEADSFYFLLSGKMAAVTVTNSSHSTFKVAGTYFTGAILGEDGISSNAERSYSMCTMEKCRLLAVNLNEFHEQCLIPPKGETNPPHIVFLSQLTFMKFFPMHKLVADTKRNLLLFYYASGSIVSEDIASSEYIYIVFKGSVRVLAEINTKRCTTVKVTLPPIIETRSSDDDVGFFPIRHSSVYPFTFHSVQSLGSTTVLPEKPMSTIRYNTICESNEERTSDTYQRIDSTNKGFKMVENLAKTWGRRTIAETVRHQSTRIASKSSLVHAASVEKFLPKRNSDELGHKCKAKSDWVHLKTLREGDVVGIEGVNLGDTSDKKPVRIAVVSRGAEMILMLKDFFTENASPLMKMDLRASSYIFPDEPHLKTELSKRIEWKRFQHKVISELRLPKD